MKLIRRSNNKETPKSSLSEPKKYNEYYENISVRLGIAQVILYLSLFAFVVLAFVFNTNLITYQNFYYFFQDLNASAEMVDIFNSDSVSYPTSQQQSFALYRRGLAVAGNHSVTVFSATGRQLLSENVQYQNPTAVGAGKYLLVYEFGGTKYSLYNSNVQIHSAQSESPIRGAAVSDSGSYALISSSQGATSTVSLYNDRFSLINRYHKSGYVMDVAINFDGEKIAILTSSPSGAGFSTSLMLAEAGRGEAIEETFVSDSIGLSCCFTSSQNISVVCQNGITFLHSDGKKLTEYSFDGKIPALMDLNADGVAVCLKKNMISPRNIVIVFDKDGKIVYNETIVTEAENVLLYGGSLFWIDADGVSRCQFKNKQVDFYPCTTSQRQFLAVAEDELLSCSPQKAFYIVFPS